MLTLGSLKVSLNNDFKESRFSNGEVCPHCQSTSIVKNGKLKDKQRYLCNTCNKSFNDLTKSALSCTKLPLEKWIEYVICTDSHKSYIQFAKNLALDHKRIMRGHYKNGIYNINHINSLHSKLNIWMYRFKGVSSKFLSNYMAWYK